MVDVVGLDLDEKSGEVVLDQVVTVLHKPGQGEGDPRSETTELKGPSLVEAGGQGEFSDKGPFIRINTRAFVLSERFASKNPIEELGFLLHSPYTSINAPVVILDGSISELLDRPSRGLTEKLSNFITMLESNGIMPNVSMMHFLLSSKEPLEDFALPVIKRSNGGVALEGALLFSRGQSSKKKLSSEQVRVLKMLLGSSNGRQKISAKFGDGVRRPFAGHTQDHIFAFSVRRGSSTIRISSQSKGLPTAAVNVNMKIDIFDLDHKLQSFKPAAVNQMELVLKKYLEQLAMGTIKELQAANSDVLGIGLHIQAFHPKRWKTMNWREDYPQLQIEPKFDIQILNASE